MSILSFVQILGSYFLFTTVGCNIFIRFCDKTKQEILQNTQWWTVWCVHAMNNLFSTAHATSCQVYPSEYAYRDDSVSLTRFESASANSRNYPPGDQKQSISPKDYIYCNGTQLKLTDSNLGQEQCQIISGVLGVMSNCCSYSPQVSPWLPSHCSTTVTVTKVFPDWDSMLYQMTLISGIPSSPSVNVAAVPPDGEPTDLGMLVNINFNTKKVLMYEYGSSFVFAVSEVEFFKCEWSCKLDSASD